MAEEDYETAADTFDKGYNALITGYKAGTGAELDQAAAAIPKFELTDDIVKCLDIKLLKGL